MKTTLVLVVLSCLLAVASISAERQLRVEEETRLQDALKVALEKFKNKPESRRLTSERAIDKFVKALEVLKVKDHARRVEEHETK
ncbi:hypothetical protein V7S43_009190 [Phytophthora oleae]|uniref:RxLR effector protein n=1 Tax=Phytophthora oleae TaxID=2107226 RepID=A0ABD3FHK0_9STRA